MLAFEGNTAPYLQYAHARICSIFRRSGADVPELKKLIVAEPAERMLAIELFGFAPVVAEVARSLEFHRLAQYLFGLATAFTDFYERCPVLKAEGDIRASRLVLADLAARTLRTGLHLLGIAAPDRM
jgi:arginyl-tRNA synthetase